MARVKKAIKKKVAAKRKRKPAAKKAPVKRIPAAEFKKEIPGAQEVMIEGSKFSHSEIPQAVRRFRPQELPQRYNRDKIVLQVRDPRWIHAYWEVKDSTIDKLKSELKDDFYKAKRMLRVYDVSYISFNGSNANRFFDIEVGEHASSWYIDTQGPGRSWCVDFGLLLPSGKFITILRSNTVNTPLDGPSWITDEEWMIPEDMFARLYGMGFGLGRSSPVGGAWQERIKQAVLSSPGVTSMASPVKKAKERKFWLVVDCELIVYGATEPNAKLTVQDMPIKLRPDGTFTLRFALPDGKQVIPVRAESADKEERRTITPIVARNTRIG